MTALGLLFHPGNPGPDLIPPLSFFSLEYTSSLPPLILTLRREASFRGAYPDCGLLLDILFCCLVAPPGAGASW